MANLASAYRQRLRNQNSLDPAEVFWQCQSDRRFAYLFYGYFIPARGELAFIDAVAGNGSILVLPEGNEAIAWLREKGWDIESTNSPLPYFATERLSDASLEKMVLHCYPDLDREVRGVLTQIKTLLSEG